MYTLLSSAASSILARRSSWCQRGFQHTEHAQCRLHTAVEVGVAERVATADEQRLFEDSHATRTIRHRGQDLQEEQKGS